MPNQLKELKNIIEHLKTWMERSNPLALQILATKRTGRQVHLTLGRDGNSLQGESISQMFLNLLSNDM